MGTIAQKGCEFFEEADIGILLVDELPSLVDRVTDAANDADRNVIQHNRCPEFAEIVTCTAGSARLADWVGNRIQNNRGLAGLKCVLYNIAVGSHIADTGFHTATAGGAHLLIIND